MTEFVYLIVLSKAGLIAPSGLTTNGFTQGTQHISQQKDYKIYYEQKACVSTHWPSMRY